MFSIAQKALYKLFTFEKPLSKGKHDRKQARTHHGMTHGKRTPNKRDDSSVVDWTCFDVVHLRQTLIILYLEATRETDPFSPRRHRRTTKRPPPPPATPPLPPSSPTTSPDLVPSPQDRKFIDCVSALTATAASPRYFSLFPHVHARLGFNDRIFPLSE